jgi:CMP-2-keto-3-deoxyoctulosonic acid synthetase
LIDEYLNDKTPYQLSEDIEWLKILEDGYKINSILVSEESHERGVDVQDDYDYLKNKYEK